MIVADAMLITKGDEGETKETKETKETRGGQECVLPAPVEAVNEEKAEAV